ncbi:MAG: MarR family winged helix-turn-helix transcriptional regulator [Desulfobulbus sp.]
MKESIGYLISIAGIRYKGKVWKCFQPYDVTPEQWVILNKLSYEDGLSQRELADRVAKNQPNTTRILDKMEQKGLIRRESSPSDRRVLLVFLTGEGIRVREKLLPVLWEIYKMSIKGFSEEELQLMKKLLARFMMNL